MRILFKSFENNKYELKLEENCMNFMSTLLSLDNVSSWQDIIDHINSSGASEIGNWGWLTNLLSVMSTLLWVLLVLVGAAGGIYSIYVGVKMARAESAEQRDENKKRLINIIVTIVVVVVLILFFNIFLPMILNAFGVFDPIFTTTSLI